MALQRVVRWITNAVFFGGVFVMAVMVLHVTVDVIARYVFNAVLPGTIAFVQHYYMIAITFLPLVVAEVENGHIDVEVVTLHLPRPIQAGLRLAAWALACTVFSVLGWYSAIHARDAYEIQMFIVEQDAKIETWISFFMPPIGYLLSALICLSRIMIAFLALRDGICGAVATAEGFFGGKRVEEAIDV